MIEPHINPPTLRALQNLSKNPSAPSSPRTPTARTHRRTSSYPPPPTPVLAVSLSNQYEVDRAINQGTLVIHLQRSCQSLRIALARTATARRLLRLAQWFASTSVFGCVITASLVVRMRVRRGLAPDSGAKIVLPFLRDHVVSISHGVVLTGGGAVTTAAAAIAVAEVARRWGRDYACVAIDGVDEATGEKVTEHFLVRNDAIRRGGGARETVARTVPFYAGIVGAGMWTGNWVAKWVEVTW